MKTKKEKKEVNKFDLERFEIAKLKKLHLVKGGGGDGTITGNTNKLQALSRFC
ncbi:hypothetical protein [Flavobacterium sp. KMS]|uniref:hypothetical protein n=1 Tax=Flavobacterium sp. KMS TaxID=1566023 RepID=UPI000B0856C7|nr:hypothetical protein [Flavobacterium sp. KMS]